MNSDPIPMILSASFVLGGMLLIAVLVILWLNGSLQAAHERLRQLAEENRALKENARDPKGWTHG